MRGGKLVMDCLAALRKETQVAPASVYYFIIIIIIIIIIIVIIIVIIIIIIIVTMLYQGHILYYAIPRTYTILCYTKDIYYTMLYQGLYYTILPLCVRRRKWRRLLALTIIMQIYVCIYIYIYVYIYIYIYYHEQDPIKGYMKMTRGLTQS